MPSQLIISVSPWDVRAALVEDGRLAELYVERPAQQDPTGNIYVGRVQKVLPGMAAAFVDVGLDKPGYLFAQEAAPLLDYIPELWLQGEKEERLSPPPTPPIDDLVSEGQDLMVQVWRPPVRTKGPRLTTHISLPGRYLVYLPTHPHLAVSRRLAPEAERRRLLQLLMEVKPREGGLIARTASAGQTLETLAAERDKLVALWQQIRRTSQKASAPALLYQELPVMRRLVRDLVTPEVTRIMVDDSAAADKITEYLTPGPAHRVPVVELYQGSEPLFAHAALEEDWQRLLAPQIWLKSGGSIVIESTEALTAIDVNSGKFIRGRDLAHTILTTNLEAAREIARQVRLRNLSGIIVIDFIDMETAAHREMVCKTLKEVLQRDRARTTVYPISPLGLVEMTRQRLRDSLGQMVTEPCRACRGRGALLSTVVAAHDLLRQLALEVREFPGCRFTIKAQDQIIALANQEGKDFLKELKDKDKVQINFRAAPDLAGQTFEILRELQEREEK
jgi:ribonuclease G|uniref:Rne/Rng family ribonuclease n=1 Tax=Desulfobacca acetoxidans TaxID=60893 RepID=A0A7V6A3L3_9BACT